jgi:DNA-binding CsgD family transcriptional regulator
MTETDRLQIKRLWDSGDPIEHIVRMLPYKQGEARSMVAELRADGTLKPRNRVQMAIAKVVNAYNSGITDFDELSAMFGFKHGYIRWCLQVAGVKRPRPKKYNTTINELAMEIMQEIATGKKTQSQIATEFGVSRQYVNQLKKRMENGNEHKTEVVANL